MNPNSINLQISDLQVSSSTDFHKPLVSWYSRNKRSLPWRLHWKKHQDPYGVWVSEIMLQQTVIKAVLPAYDRFMSLFPTYKELAKASEEDVRLASRGLGYYRRFRMLHQAAQLLDQNPDLVWPTSAKEWKALPGVGDYTSAAIASICFNEAIPVVDGNVERVFCRLFDIRLAPNLPVLKRKFFELGLELIDPKKAGDYNQAVMELGQRVCTPTSPSCEQCPVSFACLANKRGSQSEAPQPKAKPVYEQVQLEMFVPIKGNSIGLMRRSDSKFLKDTWGFPTAISHKKTVSWDGKVCIKMPNQSAVKAVGSFKHSITKHKITANVQAIQSRSEKLQWLDPKLVEAKLVSNLDRKAWKLIQKKLHLE